MAKYLYGAAVQGIQSFIFQTNKLNEIVGASEIVAQICTNKFCELLYGSSGNLTKTMEEDTNFIVHAAGNIKYIFDKKEDCAKIVREFPKKVMTYAPGITISQAVVDLEDGKFHDAVDDLEKRLQIQRNKPMRSVTLGLIGIRRSRSTGLPAVKAVEPKTKDKNSTPEKEFLDEGSVQKREASNTIELCKRSFGEHIDSGQVAFNVEDITDKNNWIAIIHADGNGLGQIVQQVGEDKDLFKRFSEDLDRDTVEAAQIAYASIKDRINGAKRIPIRPIVLSGDDFTAICRADLALDYTEAFIKAFEEKTTGIFKEYENKSNKVVFSAGDFRDRMTACAGIAYIKASYPFYYGYQLAEALCSEAKKDAKEKESIKKGEELPQSCIMFHKVQDSFNESYEDIVKRELSPAKGYSLKFGPYYIKEKADRWTVDRLKEACRKLEGEDGNKVKSTIRKWLSALYQDSGKASQLIQRAQLLYEGNDILTTLNSAVKTENGRIPAYDMLVINTINNQVTNE